MDTSPSRENGLRMARATAELVARERPDYRIMQADELGPGDGLRLVPVPGIPTAVAFIPLVVATVIQEFGLVAVTVRPRAGLVRDVADDIGIAIDTPRTPEDYTSVTVVLDPDFPVLVR